MSNPVLARQYDIVREDLHRRFDQLHEPEIIDSILNSVIDELSTSAKVETFLPVLVEREASERIVAAAESLGIPAFERPEILFADEHNAGRAQIATALTHHLAGDKVFVRSIGLKPTAELNQRALELLNSRGIATSNLNQNSITPRVSHRANVIVLMGIDEVPSVPGNRYVTWDITDPANADDESLNRIIDDIERNVRQLLDELDIPSA